ncbi:Type I Iterative PKS [Onygenales sp. PD_12]|nr:Type I Iterative PKS [Onygenales sp. PD_12]
MTGALEKCNFRIRQNEPIAIVGSACRFPGGCNSPSKLWELLREPRDILRKIPKSRRFNIEAFYHPDPSYHGTTHVQHSYFLDEDLAQFDANFFNITAKEAESMDPQQRFLMETVYDSLCAAGLPVEKLRGTPVAVYVGLMCDDWTGMLQKDLDTLPIYSTTGSSHSIMSSRLSYFFGWHGPCLTIDTACSSSLVAVHEAVRVLRSGESKVAIAAGANLILSPDHYIAESKFPMLSPTGRCRMWDASADGYSRGEGVASLVLKTLSQAILDGDHIECIIRETGVNQDGRSSGLTVPNHFAQTNLIRETYARAGLDIREPSDCPQFFQAHGTGTKVGDPQEAEAIHDAFSSAFNGSSDKLYVGSIKTIIGHTEGTAGLASLIAASLAIQNSTIPPNMHFNSLNPDLASFCSHFDIPTTPEQWPALVPGGVRRASVNSFGFGGTNAHAIIEEYIPIDQTLNPASNHILSTPFTFSANSATSLKSTLSEYLTFLAINPETPLRDLAWTLQYRRSILPNRKTIVALSYDEICEKIAEELNDDDPNFGSRYGSIETPQILGIFTGQGAQWPRMGYILLLKSPFVAKRIADLDEFLATTPAGDPPEWSIREELMAPDSSSRLGEAEISQPLCTAVQIILVDLLHAAGIKLKAVVGHSSGEIGAAYAAGLLSAPDAIRIAYYRGLYSKLALGKGAMLAVNMSAEEGERFCNSGDLNGRISIAAYNSSSSLTLSGDEDAIEEAIDILKTNQKFARRLKVDKAYHSVHMKPSAGPYLDAISRCEVKVLPPPTNRPIWFSTVIKGCVMAADKLDGNYWVNNMIQPVLFSSAIVTATNAVKSLDLTVEIGPDPALKSPAMNNLAEMGMQPPYTGVLSRGKDDLKEMSSALGFIWTNLGMGSVNFDNFDKVVNGDNVTRTMVPDLPGYPFDHQRSYWIEPSAPHAPDSPPHPLLGKRCLGTTTSNEIQWRNILKPSEIPWLRGHKLQNQVIFPATGYIVMAIEAILPLACRTEICCLKIEDIIFERAISFYDDNASVETLFSIKIHRSNSRYISVDFECYSRPEGDSAMAGNARGRIEAQLGPLSGDTLPFTQHTNQFNLVDVDVNRFYSALDKIGYQYSDPFHGLETIKRKMGCAFGTLIDQSGSKWEDNLALHPGMLDTTLQAALAAFCYPSDETLRAIVVPVSIDSLIINPYFLQAEDQKHANLHWEAVVRDEEDNNVTADVQLFAGDKKHTFLQFDGVTLRPLTPLGPEDDATLFSHFDYLQASPNGCAAVGDNRVSAEEFIIGKDMERLALFYIRRLSEMSHEDRANALPHHKHLLAWADYTMDRVRSGQHISVEPACLEDTEEKILALTDKYRDRVDALIIESTGQNLPATIRSQASILEHMTKDNMLDRLYGEAIGLNVANLWVASMAKQISHRYPQMKILEIGAGTGGSTQAILPALGNAFSSYTFTDVSSGFFERAEEKFKEYSDRMVFKVFDMLKPAADQGFVEGTYDMVLASNVLHVADDMDDMMLNVRRLLKPGGFLVVLEIFTNELLRNGLIMGGLPGWWVGADSGRPHGPMLTLDAWESLVSRCGFGGIETCTPIFDKVYSAAVWVAQAIDDRIDILRNPTTSDVFCSEPPLLVVIGGKSVTANQLSEQVTDILSDRFSSYVHLPSVEDLTSWPIPPGATVLSLVELDEPLMRTFTEGKLDGLKILWGNARNVLWVTQGARCHEPYSYMMFGISRVVRFEHPNLNLQMLDIDTLDEFSGKYIAEALLRLQYLDSLHRESKAEDILWSSEPEIFLENVRTLIPRLYPNELQNMRANSNRRRIAKHVNPRESTIRIVGSGLAFELEETMALEVPLTSLGHTKSGTIRIQHSLLQFIRIGSAGSFMVCIGTKDDEHHSTILTLAHAAESLVPLEPMCSITLPKFLSCGKMALLTVGAYLVAQQVLDMVPKDSTVLIHEPDMVLKSTISLKAARENTSVVFTTCQAEKQGADWTLIHPMLSTRKWRGKIPADVSLFIDFSLKDSPSAEMARTIRKLLPHYCVQTDASTFFGNKIQVRNGEPILEAGNALHKAWTESTTANVGVESVNSIPLNEISNHNPTDATLTVVDWMVPTVPVLVRPIDRNSLFKSDKTYLMVGLSGEVGQSLCQWMVSKGARFVVLASRNPVVEPEFISSLEETGASIRVMSMDITCQESLKRCLDDIDKTMPEIYGVANGALIVADSTFEKLDMDSMNKVLKPKVEGSKLLDEVFHETPLDFFIMFSSLVSCLGNTGQSNYCAANMFMTSLAFQRRRRGVAGSVIDLSSLMGIGHVGRSEVFDAEYFAGIGGTSVSERDLHQMFAEAINVGKPDSTESAEIVTGISPMYTDELELMKVKYRSDLKFSHFVRERPTNQGYPSALSTMSVRAQLPDVKSVSQLAGILLESFKARMKKILRIPADEIIDENKGLLDYGVDSLVTIDLRSWFVRELDVDMPVLNVLGGNSIASLISDAIGRIPTTLIDVSKLAGGDGHTEIPAPIVPKPINAGPEYMTTKSITTQESSLNEEQIPNYYGYPIGTADTRTPSLTAVEDYIDKGISSSGSASMDESELELADSINGSKVSWNLS